MSLDSEIACPRCGMAYRPEEGEHVCAILDDDPAETGQSYHPELETTLREATDFGRVVYCPQCRNPLDVSIFDPLDTIECCHCKTHFELMKDFGEGRLIQEIDVGWEHAFYVGEDIMGPGKYLIKVLSAHVLAQPNSVLNFLAQAQNLISQCRPDMVRFTDVKSENGYLYLVIALHDGILPEKVLNELGFQIPSDFQAEYQVELPPRFAICPFCKGQVSAAGLDPLDVTNCPHCNQGFEILRQMGDFRIDYRLNAGGTSVLYLAQDLRNNRKLALKVLSAAEMLRNPESAENMRKEVELTQKLRHPNVIQVYEGGQFQGFYYMSMELVDGLTVNQILGLVQLSSDPGIPMVETMTNREKFRQGLPELVSLEISLQTAAGLGVAHQNGLIHGDVKPENIMITREGVVKVLDFGLVKFANAEIAPEDESEDMAIFGTPFYIPPERVRGEPEDFRSDMYSLGATLYHLLRGMAPFRAKSGEEIAFMHAVSPMVKFKAFVPWISDTTARVVERSMSKSVADRYSSHIELIADLTLAKNQVLQSVKGKPLDGRKILQNFISKLPAQKKSMGVWKRAATAAIHTYKYATMAITNRVRSAAAKSKLQTMTDDQK